MFKPFKHYHLFQGPNGYFVIMYPIKAKPVSNQKEVVWKKKMKLNEFSAHVKKAMIKKQYEVYEYCRKTGKKFLDVKNIMVHHLG